MHICWFEFARVIIRQMDSSIANQSVVHKRATLIQQAIKLVILVISLGYSLVWIMMPTSLFFQNWLPHIYVDLNSTYLGHTGSLIVIYTFPILLVATLGCVYVHLEKYKNNNNHFDDQREYKTGHLGSSWSRPALVKGPLGIVSWTELSFLSMFVALFIWSFSSYLRNAFKYITPQHAAKMGVKLWEAKLEGTGLRFGLVGNILLTFLFYPVCRGSSILRLVGLTSEGSIEYHIWLGHTAMLLFTAHGLCYVILWVSTHQIAEMVSWGKVGVSNLAGEISLAAGLLMWSTTSSRIRRKAFELFFYTHYLYIVFVVFFVFHVGFGYFCIMLPGFYLFLVDRFLRFLQSQQRVGVVSARVLPCHTVELNFSKTPSLRYNPTSCVFVNMPGISKLQWHPFTVTSSSKMDCDTLSVVIKSAGSWSQRLYQILSSPALPKHYRLEVGLEGPYGPAAVSTPRFLGHERLVMVSGGSGITPFISIIRELIHIAATSSTRRLPKLLLVAAFKNSVDLTMLDLVLPLSGTPHDISRLGLRIEAYVTRDKEPAKEEEQKSVHTIWFKPDPADKPVSAVLGPNSWLYLGAVISSSFIIFLLIIGILTRYYIYPIDPAINEKYNNSSESALYMLFLCIAIAMAATTGFVWNKKQIQNTNTPSVHNGDRELESLPHQSLAQLTTTHYGERPNLKNILMMESKGVDVGVFVSGPRGLRQEVAKICSSSGVSDNLHFESFSFTW